MAEFSALIVVRFRPSRLDRLHARRSQVPVLRFPTLVPLAGELSPVSTPVEN